jgi:BirA family transcriptional regulator, biotin operon repressor / biotin---[acetyl-CoA-carboxylase] ligase
VPKPLIIFNSIDSTNKYAMAQITQGLAAHGQGYAANYQTNGQGQRGKNWQAQPGQNLLLTVVANTKGIAINNMALFNQYIAYTVYQFVKTFAPNNVAIKWPNDIILNDKKAAGILIENKLQGTQWQWAVIGVGINVNQTQFTQGKPISLHQVTGKLYDVALLQQQLYQQINNALANLDSISLHTAAVQYNQVLYKKYQRINLLINGQAQQVKVHGVNQQGNLEVLNTLTQTNFTVAHGVGQWLL